MKCGRCGGATRSEHMPDLVHTTCVVRPTAEETTRLVRYAMGSSLPDDKLPQVLERVAICVGCEHFTGLGCTELGSRCRERRFRWFGRLLEGDCPVWRASLSVETT